MRRSLIPLAILALWVPAQAVTFREAPLLEDQSLQRVDRTVTRAELDRELFGAPYATVVVGHTDVYDRFPYLEARWFQIVSDPAWNRLVAGEVGGRVTAVDGSATPFGTMDAPHGMATDEYDRVWVADSGNHRVLVFQARTEYGRIELSPLFSVEGLSRPYDVAFSDGGTPFVPGDDRVYVADTGANRVVAFDVREGAVREAFATGHLGRGVGSFAGPVAITVGRSNGVANGTVYVADAHNGRIVSLRDGGDRFAWVAEAPSLGTVTALDTDHWGAVYAAAPSHGVTKYAADLTPLAGLETLERPRAFHVPFVNRTDHRTGETRRVGQGAGLALEEWTDHSGVRLVRLGADVRELAVQPGTDLAAQFVLTGHAQVRAEFLDPDGRVSRTVDLGLREAGLQHVTFASAELRDLPTGEDAVRITASSTYAESDGGSAEASFTWSGSGLAPNEARVIASEPNPFRSSTTIRFAVPANASRFDLRIFDIAGRLVRVLDEGVAGAGVQVRTWDGHDGAGRPAQAGIYFVQLGVGDAVSTGKVVLLR
ncbi:T9SS type A sorting domain-containing protein [bacterium]|nr:T9SS type A sorting domain-containing protein [bacterium]